VTWWMLVLTERWFLARIMLPPLVLVICSRITSRSPMRPEAKRAVPPPSEAEHLNIRVLPQFSTIV
jgi:hypothetical protein